MSSVQLPPHGRIQCNSCFSEGAQWGKSRLTSQDGWALDYNPCAWGSSNPRFLLLGFSKGERQSQGILAKAHNEIPYAGFRSKLTAGLRVLGLLQTDEDIDSHLYADEKEWGFGSLVRCTLSKDNRKSGTIIPQSTLIGSHRKWFSNCTRKFLTHLPDRLQKIVILSNDDNFVDQTFSAVKNLHPTTRRINSVAYGDVHRTWIHIVHFGGQGFNHMNSWLAGSPNKAGRKRLDAVKAMTHNFEERKS